MVKLAYRSLGRFDGHTLIFLLLLWRNIGMVRPEDRVNDGVTLPTNKPRDDYLRLAGVGKGSSLKKDLFADLYDWSKRGSKQYLNPDNSISTVLDIKSKTQGIQILESTQTLEKPRFLCLHGHRSTAAILKDHLKVWPKYVLEKMDLVFINGPFPIADGFEWFTMQDDKTYKNFDEGVAYIEVAMVELGPFDGVLGFSQGAIVTGALPGMQKQGVCLTKVGEIQHVILISGAKFGTEKFPFPKLAESAYSYPIKIPSLQIFGESDIARTTALELLKAYVDPMMIYHHGGHEVPKLDEEGLNIMFEFLKKIHSVV